MANIDIQVKIKTGSDIGDITLIDKLKRYATEQFGWTEQIPDPDNEGEFIDNPVTYAEPIVVGEFLNRFKAWDKETTFQDERNQIGLDVEAYHATITTTAEVAIP